MDMRHVLYKILYHKYDRYYFDDTKTSLVSGYKDLFDRGKMFDDLIKLNKSDVKEYRKVFGTGKNKIQDFDDVLNILLKCELRRGHEDFDTYYQRLLDELSGLTLNRKNEDICKRYIYVFNTRGLFRATCILREKYMTYVLEKGKMHQKFSVYVENGDYDKAKRLMDDSLFFRLIKVLKSHEYETYANCIGMFENELNYENENDQLFKSIIKNRRIVIIGPSDNQDETKITQNDIVIQYAFMGKKLEKNNELKLNLSYYNGRYGAKLAELEDDSFLDELQMLVFKYEENNPYRKQKYKQNRARRARWSHRIMCLGSPNMLQITLTDLLLMGAKDIYVTDNNLYLNNNYNKNYISNATIANMDDYTKRMQFAQHDIIGNFQYLKALYKKGYFKCDDVLKRIMNLSSMEYAYEMEVQNGCLRR